MVDGNTQRFLAFLCSLCKKNKKKKKKKEKKKEKRKEDCKLTDFFIMCCHCIIKTLLLLQLDLAKWLRNDRWK